MGGILTRQAPLLLLSVIILLALNFLVYSGSLKNGFAFDDQTQIVNNALITDYSNLPKIFTSGIGKVDKTSRAPYYRPLHFTVYTVEYSFFKLEPMGWHLVNVLMHFLNATMVFFLSVLILKNAGFGQGPSALLPALAGAAVFTAHPAGSEVVAWTGCMPELLFTFLSLSAFYLYVKAREYSSGGAGSLLAALSVAIYFLSNFAKETAILLPAILFTFDWAMGRLKSIKALLWYLPFAAAAIAYIVIRAIAIGEVPPMEKFYPYLSLGQYFLNLFPLAAGYIPKLFAPFSYTPFEVWNPVFSIAEPRAFVSVIVIVSIAVLYLVFRRRLNPMATLAFVIMLLPVLQALLVINLSPTPQADRYLYYSTFGLAVGVCVLIASALRRYSAKGVTIAAAALTVVFVGAFSVESIERSKFWASDLVLWQRTVEASPDNYFSRHFLGVGYVRSGSTQEGLSEFERSVALNTGRPHPDNIILLRSLKALGLVKSRTGRMDEARGHYERALAIDPEDFEVNSSLGSIYFNAGDYAAAQRRFEAASSLAATRLQARDAMTGLAESYRLMGSKERAIATYKEALSLYPGDADFTEGLERLQ